MKHLFLFAFLLCAIGAHAQTKPTLKELLYSGKLKKDTSGVVRSTDDLSAKIDTTTKKPEPVKPAAQVVNAEAQKNTAAQKMDNPAQATTGTTETGDSAPSYSMPGTTDAPPVAAGPTKTNTKLWKEYSDSLVVVLKEGILKSKQIKKDTYFLMVDYEIGTDGQVTVLNVTSTPEHNMLQAQVRQLLETMPLRLNPATDSANQARKVKRKQQIMVTKD